MDVDPWEEGLNWPPSAEGEQLWAQMGVSNCDTQQMQTTIPDYQSDPEEAEDEGQGTEDGEEQETQLCAAIPPQSSAVRIHKKLLHSCKALVVEIDDHHLAAFMYSHLLPETSLLAHCHRKVLNHLCENDQVGV